MNSKPHYHTPLYAILCDGRMLDFFTFDGYTHPPKFSRGLFLHPDGTKTRTLELPSYEKATRVRFIKALRSTCEFFYAISLHSYVNGLQFYSTRL